jgi:uncharacterized membrane protein YphA (DoxX/SURF4 family)
MEAFMVTATAEEISVNQQVVRWSPATRIAFRFTFIYFSLYCITTQIITSLVPLPAVDIPDPSAFWPVRPVVEWTALHIFRVTSKLVYTGSGSGDKTFDWVLVFCLLLFSVVATVFWSVLDRKRLEYVAMQKWFRVAIRICLAGQLIGYGLAKAVPLQMPFPYLTQLLQPYGNKSPMGVLWSSIGSAPAYEIFAGCAELLGGVLLIFPRTTTLGALVCLADMTEVFMLNMTYDVPVKLLSFQLILMSLLLLAPELHRLLKFFVMNQPVEPSNQPALFTSARANRIALIAQIIIGVWLLGMNAYGSRQGWFQYGGGRPKSEFYGIWDVDQELVDGQVRPPLMGDEIRWRRAIFDFPQRMSFQRIDESYDGHGATINTQDKTLALTKNDDKNWKATFKYDRPTPDQLILDGAMDGHQFHIELKLYDRNKFLLVNRGFHWIQEYPFNR